ncbi:MAG: hypothetical protein JNM19_03645 [Chitinophagaceae bacterium]|nr:hypothetical protein [Chitinophagaceae bacterium]
MQRLKFPVLFLSCVLSTTAFAQPTQISVQRGQKFQVESSSKVTSSAEVMGQTMENNSDTKNTIVYEVLGAGQDGISLQSTTTKMLINVSAMGQEMTFDSDKKDNEGPLADALSPSINKSKSVILDVKGAIVKQDEDATSGPALGGMGAITAAFSTDLFLPALIGKELTAGVSFTDVASQAKEKFTNRDSGTYVITAVENGVASISYKGIQISSMVMEQMGMEMTSSSNNTVKSELQVDVKTGLILARATVIDMNISVDAGGMTIPATGQSITTVKVTPVQ